MLGDTDCEDMELAFATNVMGPFRLTKALLGALASSAREGRDAVFSAGPRERGTVLVDCSKCHARGRVTLAGLVVRLLTGSLIWPGRRKGWFLRCPTCGARAWCSVSFRG